MRATDKPWFPHSCARAARQVGSPCVTELCEHHICGDHCDGYCHEFTCSSCVPAAPALGGGVQMITHVKMYAVGDKYDVPDLKELAQEEFSRACSSYWNEDVLCDAAELVFTSSPEADEGLRIKIVRDTLFRHRFLIRKLNIKEFLQSTWR